MLKSVLLESGVLLSSKYYPHHWFYQFRGIFDVDLLPVPLMRFSFRGTNDYQFSQ